MKQNRAEACKLLFFAFFFFISIFPSTGLSKNKTSFLIAADTQSSSVLLLKAKSCKNKLLHSQKKRIRSKWLLCVLVYQQALKQKPSEEVQLEAYTDLTDLYHQLGRYSGKKSDKGKEKYWEEMKLKLASRSNQTGSPLMTPEKAEQIPASGEIFNLRTWNHREYLRIVLDLKGPVKYEIHEFKESGAVQIDFPKTTLQSGLNLKVFPLDKTQMQAQLSQLPDRALLSLTHVSYKSLSVTELLNPGRLVIDFHKTDETVSAKQEEDALSIPPPKKTLEDLSFPKPGIHKIIIDPGHGGKDPGAIGLSGYPEKEAVLDIGLRLKELVMSQLKVNVIMTRSKDVFISLEERAEMANEANVDLFISIHANSSPHRTTHGIEIYLLGQSSDKRALRTAARENNSTEKEAVDLEKNLFSIKKDLTQEYKKEESLELAHITRSSFLNILRPLYPVVDLGIKTAPFYVLMHTSMPSILAEVSFISNPVEEQRLKNPGYRQKMAESLLEAIQNYVSFNSPLASF
ncbi:MAG: N-acetylmuramoyl-L-alanine amidase [Nitrospirae bacterium]|nr:N-acetylmuramoyl-L-alanine amidase [Nitrospirota bacterium]